MGRERERHRRREGWSEIREPPPQPHFLHSVGGEAVVAGVQSLGSKHFVSGEFCTLRIRRWRQIFCGVYCHTTPPRSRPHRHPDYPRRASSHPGFSLNSLPHVMMCQLKIIYLCCMQCIMKHKSKRSFQYTPSAWRSSVLILLTIDG